MNRSEAMEKALKLCISEMCEQCREAAGAEAKRYKMPHHVVCVNECETLRIAKDALALPRRQCDVGTAEEQAERMRRQFCAKLKRDGIIDCSLCPIRHAYQRDCTLAWAQMPYEAEEGAGK